MAKMGRPSLYTPTVAAEICERLASGEHMRKICEDAHMPWERTVYRWIRMFPDFCQQYVQARTSWTECQLEEIISIANDGSNDTYVDKDGKERVDNDNIQRSRLRVDTYWRAMQALNPKRFGDKTQNHVTVDITTLYTQDDNAIMERYAKRISEQKLISQDEK